MSTGNHRDHQENNGDQQRSRTRDHDRVGSRSHRDHGSTSHRPSHHSSDRHRSRSRDRRPRNIRELREQRIKERERRRRSHHGRSSHKSSKSQFDVPPDPNAPVAGITKSLEIAKETSAQTGIAASSVLGTNLIVPKEARSVYVGGFTVEHAEEKPIFEFFNKVVNLASGQEINPVVSVYLNKQKLFAFVEFNDYNIASAVIDKLNGVEYKGRPMSLRRPTNYDQKKLPPMGEPLKLDPTKVGLKAGRPSSHVPSVPEKIYVAGIPMNVSDDQVQELLEAFGPLESLFIVRERGYAFCLYKDRSVTDTACAALDGIQLGAQTLVVKRADVNVKPNQPGVNYNDVSVVSNMLPDSGGLEAYGYGGVGAKDPRANPFYLTGGSYGALTSAGQGDLRPTKVLVLKNMVEAAELADDQEYEEVLADVRQECQKFGSVVSLKIPRPNGDQKVFGLGMIFVEFTDEVDSLTAKQGLDGRSFADRQVVCEFLSEADYHSKIY